MSEGGRSISVSLATIRTNEHLRAIEDLWPELVELHSTKPGDYDLFLPSGVPQGLGATIVKLRSYSFHSVTSWISPDLQYPSKTGSR